MDSTLVIAIIGGAVAFTVPVLTVLLNQWFNRRKDAADLAQKEADTKKTDATTRHAEEEERRKANDNRLGLLEKLGAADTGGLREALAALERSRAAEAALKDTVAALERSRAAEVGALTSQVETMTKGMAVLTTQVKDLTEKVTNLETLMGGANETINQQGESLRVANESLKEANVTIIALNKEVSELKALVLAANETIARLEQTIKENTAVTDERISSLIEQIKGLGVKPVGGDEVVADAEKGATAVSPP